MCTPSADIIKSPSVTMISTASMEPGNPASAELSWKTVKKGYRSATRRPRKINPSLNIGMQDNDKGSEEEPSATESEEFGLAVLGHRFSEKIDHLPIKKRRSMQQSPPSPPHIPFDQWGGLVPVQTSSHNEKSVVNRKPPNSEDSYGIELLAAAACDTSITDEILNVKEVKVEEKSEVLAQTADVSEEVSNVEAVKVEENSEVVPQSDGLTNVTMLEETIVCSQKQNSLLKDINSGVAHDGSRDQNSNDNICSQKQNLLVKDINSVSHEDSRDQNHYPGISKDIHDKSDSICSQKQNSLLKDINVVANDDSRDQNNFPAVSGDIHDESNIICSQKENSLLKNINNDDLSDQNNSPGVSGDIHDKSGNESKKSSSSGKYVRLHWDLNTVMDDWELPPENMNTNSPRNVSVDFQSEGFPDGETGKLNSESLFKEKINPPTTSMAVKVEENHILGSDLHLGQTLSVENVDSTILNDTNTTHLAKIDINVTSEIDPTLELNKLDVDSCKRTGEAALEDFLDDGDISDYSPGGHYRFARFDKMSKYKSGCESPVEDGELRESIAYSWQENEDETELVDYEMDDRDETDDFAIGNNSVSKAGCSSNQIDSNGKNVSLKELNQSTIPGKSSGWDQIPNGYECVNKSIEANNGKIAEIGAYDSSKKLDGKGLFEEKVGSRPIEGNFSTRLLRFSRSGGFDGKDTRDGQQSSRASFQDGQVHRFDRHPGRDSFVSRMQDGSQKISQTSADVSHKWDSRNHYQNGCQRGSGNPRLRNNENTDANDDDLAYDDHLRRSRGNYLRGGYRPFVRRLPDDDNYDTVKRGNFVTVDDGHYRSRGRSGFHRQGFLKGSRDEFADDSPPSSVWVPHHHSDRRKPSPVYNRDNSFSRPSRNSLSQSRSRSPVPWHMQRERNGGRRQISRSPDFRSEGRMGIKRMQNDEPKFSPPRRSFSNDRKSGLTRYKDRDSPGIFFKQHQRFGSDGTVGRMGKNDDGFRPRLNNNSNNYYYNNSDSQRTRYNNKPEMIRGVRHNETGGTEKRFRGDADDGLGRHFTRNGYNNNNKSNSYIRNMEKSDTLGKRLFKRDNDRIYTTSSKFHAIREYEDSVSANRG